MEYDKVERMTREGIIYVSMYFHENPLSYALQRSEIIVDILENVLEPGAMASSYSHNL